MRGIRGTGVRRGLESSGEQGELGMKGNRRTRETGKQGKKGNRVNRWNRGGRGKGAMREQGGTGEKGEVIIWLNQNHATETLERCSPLF